jgi:predicted GIY-YIG superfamily endonuclease
MSFWVYILKCADGRYYTGQTDDLDRRLAEHQVGGFCDFTARRRPVILAWAESLPSRIEALEAERRLKGWSRAKKEAMIAGDWSRLSHFARPPVERTQASSARETRPSTSLGTNGGVSSVESVAEEILNRFVSSVVETCVTTPEHHP